MTPAEFTAWRRHLGVSKRRAAEMLGVSINMPTRYERGETDIPRFIALACAAIAHNLPPYGDAP